MSEQMTLEHGKTYKVKANISGVEKWHTVVRRNNDEGVPVVYYCEEDFEDYYYDDDNWTADNVRELE